MASGVLRSGIGRFTVAARKNDESPAVGVSYGEAFLQIVTFLTGLPVVDKSL